VPLFEFCDALASNNMPPRNPEVRLIRSACVCNGIDIWASH
jgi:hypothetical protein